MDGIGHVAGGEHGRVRGAQALVDVDAVRHGEPGVGRERHDGRDPDPDEDEVGRHRGAVAEFNAGDRADSTGRAVRTDRAVPGQARDLRPGEQVDPMLAVQVREHLGDLRAEDPQQRQRGDLEDRHVETRDARGGGDLEADPARPDDHDPRGLAEGQPEPLGVLEPAQVDHVVQLGARHVQPAGLRTGRQEQPVVGERLAVIARDRAGGTVERGHGRAEPQLDLVPGVPVARVHEDVLERRRALQQPLGQRWALIRAVRLGAEEHEAAGEPLLP